MLYTITKLIRDYRTKRSIRFPVEYVLLGYGAAVVVNNAIGALIYQHQYDYHYQC